MEAVASGLNGHCSSTSPLITSEQKNACFFAQRWWINSPTVESDKRTIRPLRGNEDEREGSAWLWAPRPADAQVCAAQSRSGTINSELLLWGSPLWHSETTHNPLTWWRQWCKLTTNSTAVVLLTGGSSFLLEWNFSQTLWQRSHVQILLKGHRFGCILWWNTSTLEPNRFRVLVLFYISASIIRD